LISFFSNFLLFYKYMGLFIYSFIYRMSGLFFLFPFLVKNNKSLLIPKIMTKIKQLFLHNETKMAGYNDKK
jgi:hypothetical protein